MQACKVTFSSSGKKCIISADCYEDLLSSAGVKLKQPVRRLELETGDGFQISSDEDFKVFVSQTVDRCFVVNIKDTEEEDVGGLNQVFDGQVSMLNQNQSLNRTESVASTTDSNNNQQGPFEDLREIIRKCGRPTAIISGLLERLDTQSILDLKDQTLLNKILATHLYVRFGKIHNPDPTIIDDLAKAITTQFPITKSSVGSGREAWFDIETGKGRLLKYVGRKRRNAGVKRPYKKKDPASIPNLEVVTSAERYMKSCKLTRSNAAQMREAHVNTFSVRRPWIVEKNPSAKEVIERFPRFMDMVEAIETDFQSITGCVVATFVNKWLAIESKIIALLPTYTQEGVNRNDNLTLTSQLAFKSLVKLLPGTPSKKTKGRKPTTEVLEKQLFQTFPANFNPSEALTEAQRNGMLQPGVLVIGDLSYFVKLETELIEIKVGSLAEAIGYLVAVYFVFNCKYPPYLNIVFSLFEHLYEIKSDKGILKTNATISPFMTKLHNTIPL